MDANRVLMQYDARKKSLMLAYLLLFVLGPFGGHRFYAFNKGDACVQLLVTLLGLAMGPLGFGIWVLVMQGIWLVIDAFLLPGQVRRYNLKLADDLAAT